jgi:hypothetical protein
VSSPESLSFWDLVSSSVKWKSNSSLTSGLAAHDTQVFVNLILLHHKEAPEGVLCLASPES